MIMKNAIKIGKSRLERSYYMSANSVSLTETENLFYEAWQKVRKKSEVAGADGESLVRFEQNLFYNISQMAQQFERNSYCLSPLNCVYIPKSDSGLRCIGIPTVRDRIVLSALNSHLTFLWDEHFSAHSFGYRQGKSCLDAIKVLYSQVENGKTYYTRGDIRGCFDSLDWSFLSRLLARALTDEPLRRFVNKSFRVPFIYKGILFKRFKGVPQGSPISPMLANLYLHQFDMEMLDRGFDVIRYGDDWICIADNREEAQEILKTACEILDQMRIKMNPLKSRIGCLETEVITFLGYKVSAHGIIQCQKNIKRGKFYGYALRIA
jgi:group II intron reverse transcriptase/maturase